MRFLICAGDPSGDNYGALLIRALKAREPSLRVDAVGGAQMKRAAAQTGCEFLFDLAGLGITGFIEPLRRVPTLIRLHADLATLMRLERPDAAVCIDYYGFHRHVLAAAKGSGVPAFYYISPQVWATRPGRLRTIQRLVDRMLVIFPFEEKLYREAGVPVAWVGHPLLDMLPSPGAPMREGDRLRIGLLPGSRPSEIERHLPILLCAASIILQERPEAEFSVFATAQAPDAAYRDLIAQWMSSSRRRMRLVREADYAERAQLDFALTSSGTATVENALLGVPMVVFYRHSWPTYALARAMIRVKHIAMANILAGRDMVPELIQRDATPEKIARAALTMLADQRRLCALRKDLLSLRRKLGGPGATGRAADILLSEASRRREEVRA
ncbi:MAG: lipid-A-disaccharide synthase [Elusimicrobia bacterium]|nr:lipid-A-disaccharide synthase [Elusimicrobiota bacterium]